MWKYILVAAFIFIGAIEIILAFNGRLRDEIMKNSPLPLPSSAKYYLLLAGISALAMAAGILVYANYF